LKQIILTLGAYRPYIELYYNKQKQNIMAQGTAQDIHRAS